MIFGTDGILPDGFLETRDGLFVLAVHEERFTQKGIGGGVSALLRLQRVNRPSVFRSLVQFFRPGRSKPGDRPNATAASDVMTMMESRCDRMPCSSAFGGPFLNSGYPLEQSV